MLHALFAAVMTRNHDVGASPQQAAIVERLKRECVSDTDDPSEPTAIVLDRSSETISVGCSKRSDGSTIFLVKIEPKNGDQPSTKITIDGGP